MVRWLMMLLLGLLVACAPRIQAPLTGVETPALNGMETPGLNDGTVLMADGARLPLLSWRPETPRAAIIAVHGFNEYSHLFAIPGPWFAERGMAVYAYDQRGFGKAPGRGLWPGDELLTADLETLVRLVRARHPDIPVFVLGTSMGGAVALSAAAEMADPKPAGLILVAPAVWGWSSLNPFYQAVLWVAAHTMPWQTFTGQDLGVQASDNIEMLRALGRDPLVIKETRTDTIYGLVGLMERAYRSVEAVQVPVLLLYGAHDEVIPPEPVTAIRSRFAAPLTVAVYQKGWHMLLYDLQRETVWTDIESWMTDASRSLPSGEMLPASSDLRTAAKP